MKDGGKPMGPTPAEKKKAEERAKKKADHIAFTKECIMKYAQRSEEKDLIAYIQKQPFWTDPVNNLKELEKLHNELQEKDRHQRETRLIREARAEYEDLRKQIKKKYGMTIEQYKEKCKKDAICRHGIMLCDMVLERGPIHHKW